MEEYPGSRRAQDASNTWRVALISTSFLSGLQSVLLFILKPVHFTVPGVPGLIVYQVLRKVLKILSYT